MVSEPRPGVKPTENRLTADPHDIESWSRRAEAVHVMRGRIKELKTGT